VWADPAETLVAPDSPDTATGVVLDVVVPFPNWPEKFAPQHRT